MKRNPDLTHGNMKCHMIRLAIPLILGNILQQTYNTIDAFVIGRYGNSFGDSGAAATSFIIAIFYTFCFIGNTFAGYLDGIEKVSIPFIGAAGHIALRVILSWIFIQDYQLPAVAFATGIGWIMVNLFWSIYLFAFCR